MKSSIGKKSLSANSNSKKYVNDSIQSRFLEQYKSTINMENLENVNLQKINNEFNKFPEEIIDTEHIISEINKFKSIDILRDQTLKSYNIKMMIKIKNNSDNQD